MKFHTLSLAVLIGLLAPSRMEAQSWSLAFDTDATFLAWAADDEWRRSFGTETSWGRAKRLAFPYDPFAASLAGWSPSDTSGARLQTPTPGAWNGPPGTDWFRLALRAGQEIPPGSASPPSSRSRPQQGGIYDARLGSGFVATGDVRMGDTAETEGPLPLPDVAAHAHSAMVPGPLVLGFLLASGLAGLTGVAWGLVRRRGESGS